MCPPPRVVNSVLCFCVCARPASRAFNSVISVFYLFFVINASRPIINTKMAKMGKMASFRHDFVKRLSHFCQPFVTRGSACQDFVTFGSCGGRRVTLWSAFCHKSQVNDISIKRLPLSRSALLVSIMLLILTPLDSAWSKTIRGEISSL